MFRVILVYDGDTGWTNLHHCLSIIKRGGDQFGWVHVDLGSFTDQRQWLHVIRDKLIAALAVAKGPKGRTELRIIAHPDTHIAFDLRMIQEIAPDLSFVGVQCGDLGPNQSLTGST